MSNPWAEVYQNLREANGDNTSRMSPMDQWRAANPKLAAAADEKARIRGTAQTDNPLIDKEMRSRMSLTPTVQSSEVSKLGQGYQSLTQNPNASKLDQGYQSLTQNSNASKLTLSYNGSMKKPMTYNAFKNAALNKFQNPFLNLNQEEVKAPFAGDSEFLKIRAREQSVQKKTSTPSYLPPADYVKPVRQAKSKTDDSKTA